MNRNSNQKKDIRIWARPRGRFSIEAEFMTTPASQSSNRGSAAHARTRAATSVTSITAPKSGRSGDEQILLSETTAPMTEFSDQGYNKMLSAKREPLEKLNSVSSTTTSTAGSSYHTVYENCASTIDGRGIYKHKIDFSKILPPKFTGKSRPVQNSRSSLSRRNTPPTITPHFNLPSTLSEDKHDSNKPSQTALAARLVRTSQNTPPYCTVQNSREYTSLLDLKFPSSMYSLRDQNAVQKTKNFAKDYTPEKKTFAQFASTLPAASKNTKFSLNMPSRFRGKVSSEPTKVLDRDSTDSASDEYLIKLKHDILSLPLVKSNCSTSTKSNEDIVELGKLSTDPKEAQNYGKSYAKNGNSWRFTDFHYFPTTRPLQSTHRERSNYPSSSLPLISMDKKESYISCAVAPDSCIGPKKIMKSGIYQKIAFLSSRSLHGTLENEEEVATVSEPLSLPSPPSLDNNLQYTSSFDWDNQTSESCSTPVELGLIQSCKNPPIRQTVVPYTKPVYCNSHGISLNLNTDPFLPSALPPASPSKLLPAVPLETPPMSPPRTPSRTFLTYSPEVFLRSPTTTSSVLSPTELNFPGVKTSSQCASSAKGFLPTYRDAEQNLFLHPEFKKKDLGDPWVPNAERSSENSEKTSRELVNLSTVSWMTDAHNNSRDSSSVSGFVGTSTETDKKPNLLSKKSMNLPALRSLPKIEEASSFFRQLPSTEGMSEIEREFFGYTITRKSSPYSVTIKRPFQSSNKLSSLDIKYASGQSLNSSFKTSGSTIPESKNPFYPTVEESGVHTKRSSFDRQGIESPQRTSTPHGTLKRRFGGLGLSQAWSDLSEIQYAESSNSTEKNIEIPSYRFDVTQPKISSQIQNDGSSDNPRSKCFNEDDFSSDRNGPNTGPPRVPERKNRLASLRQKSASLSIRDTRENATAQNENRSDLGEIGSLIVNHLNISTATEDTFPFDESLDLDLSRPLPPLPALPLSTERSEKTSLSLSEESMHLSDSSSPCCSASEQLSVPGNIAADVSKDQDEVMRRPKEQLIIIEESLPVMPDGTKQPKLIDNAVEVLVENFSSPVVSPDGEIFPARPEAEKTSVVPKKKVQKGRNPQKRLLITKRSRRKSRLIVIQYIYQTSPLTPGIPSVHVPHSESLVVQQLASISSEQKINVREATLTVPIDGQEAFFPGTVSNLRKSEGFTLLNKPDTQNYQMDDVCKAVYADSNGNVNVQIRRENGFSQARKEKSEPTVGEEQENLSDDQPSDDASYSESSNVLAHKDSHKSISSIDFDYSPKKRSLCTISEHSEDEAFKQRVPITVAENSASDEGLIFVETVVENDDFQVHSVVHEKSNLLDDNDIDGNEAIEGNDETQQKSCQSNSATHTETLGETQPLVFNDDKPEENLNGSHLISPRMSLSRKFFEQEKNKVLPSQNFEKQAIIDISNKSTGHNSAHKWYNETSIAVDLETRNELVKMARTQKEYDEVVNWHQSVVETPYTNVDKRPYTSTDQTKLEVNELVTPNCDDNLIYAKKCNTRTEVVENTHTSTDQANSSETQTIGSTSLSRTSSSEESSEQHGRLDAETFLDAEKIVSRISEIAETPCVIQEQSSPILTDSKLCPLTQDHQGGKVLAKTLFLPPVNLILRRYSEGDADFEASDVSPLPDTKLPRRNSDCPKMTKTLEEVPLDDPPNGSHNPSNASKVSRTEQTVKTHTLLSRPTAAPPKPPIKVSTTLRRRAPHPPSRPSTNLILNAPTKSLSERFAEAQEARCSRVLPASYLTDIPQRQKIDVKKSERGPRRFSAAFTNVQLEPPSPFGTMTLKTIPKEKSTRVELPLQLPVTISTKQNQSYRACCENSNVRKSVVNMDTPTQSDPNQLTQGQQAEQIFGRIISFSEGDGRINAQLREIEGQQANLSAKARLLEQQIYEATKDCSLKPEIPHLVLDQDTEKYCLTNEVSSEFFPESLVEELYQVLNMKNQLAEKYKQLKFLQQYNELQREQTDIEVRLRCLSTKNGSSIADAYYEKTLLDKLIEVVEQRDKLVGAIDIAHGRTKLLEEFSDSSEALSEKVMESVPLRCSKSMTALDHVDGTLRTLRKKKRKGVKYFIKKKYKRVFN